MVNEGPVDPEHVKHSVSELLRVSSILSGGNAVTDTTDKIAAAMDELRDNDMKILGLIHTVSATQDAYTDIIRDVSGGLLLLKDAAEEAVDRDKSQSALAGFMLLWLIGLTIAVVLLAR